MIPLNINLSHRTLLPSSYSYSPSLTSRFPTAFSLLKLTPEIHSRSRSRSQNGRGGGICRAELQQDAPFAIAIGASMLNSLLFTTSAAGLTSYDFGGDEEEVEDAAVSTTDARFAVMTIIGFIPYFNWLSWVFALMDTGKRRYAVYALVYLAPYLRTNLSLSPEESWLPIASIVLCVIHIQLEASIASGDLLSFNFFNEIWKRLGMINLKKDIQPTQLRKEHEGRRHNNVKLPSGQQHSRDEIKKWRVPRQTSEDAEHVNEDGGLDDGTKH